MLRGTKQVLAGTSMASIALLSASAAYGLILPGNFWPNPTLEEASTTEANSPSMGAGGTWRRGGGDFGLPTNPGPYTFDFWDDVKGTVSGTHALRLQDDSTTGNGEWFVPDFDADATVVPITPGSTLEFHFYWNYQTTAPAGIGADMRVTIRGTDGISSFGLGSNFDFLANGTTNGQWVEADFIRTMPAGVTGIRMNIASGGGAEVTGYLAVDDISVREVPEPASALALAGLGGLLIRRRSR